MRAMKSLSWIALALPCVTDALEIRGYAGNESTYDRFTGLPAAPAFNPNFRLISSQYTGVGWADGFGTAQRQPTLVSPRHVLLPSHWLPPLGAVISFLNANGQVVTRTLESTAIISDVTMGNSDITLGRLNAPILASEEVEPMPYTTVANGDSLEVLGFYVKAGTGMVSVIANGDIAGNQTRLYGFAYELDSGGNADCYFVAGDSGSPTFKIVGGGPAARPAVVGIHAAVDTTDNPLMYTNYDANVGFYDADLNAKLALDGYKMRPATLGSVNLTIAGPQLSPAPPAKGVAQTATLQINNTSGIREANNPTLEITFQEGQAPDNITASSGWVVDQSGPTTWLLHRATIAAASNATVDIHWDALPAVSDIPIMVTAQAFNAAAVTQTLHLTPVAPYESWSNILAPELRGMDIDVEGDGRVNLLEYAYGSNPSQGSMNLTSAVVASPIAHAVPGAGYTEISMPVRSDSQARGLWYRPYYSATLESASWTQTAPAGTTVDFVNYSPAIPGFARMRIRLTPPLGFVRIEVELNESLPGMDVPITP